ncbi:MAG TPA: hypothetical protein VFR49_04030, partial [Solirubrobacteraceae bacterium]|nr:hypothetical protein [Solirubrobacteraceae bacterium]
WEDPLTGGALAVGAAGEAVPVIFSGDFGATISYYRPPASSTDYNAGDEVPNVDTLSLNVLTGRLISVTIRPGSETVAAGTAVSFTAVDDHGSPFDPRTDSTTWAVDGGPPSPPSPSFSQTFSNGEHTITAVVSDGQGGGGAATVQITVGRSQSSTPGSQDSNSPGNTQQPGAPAIGPQQSAGTVPGGAPGARNPRPSPATSKATTVRHAGPTPPKKVTAAAPKPRPVAPTPLAAPSPNTGAPVAGPRPSVAPGRKVPLVSGRLIGNVTLLRPDQSPLVKIVASNATAPPVQRPTRTSILPGLAGALAVLVLLALGAGHQLRWRLRPVRQLVTG